MNASISSLMLPLESPPSGIHHQSSQIPGDEVRPPRFSKDTDEKHDRIPLMSFSSMTVFVLLRCMLCSRVNVIVGLILIITETQPISSSQVPELYL